jgi:hypothetical protein
MVNAGERHSDQAKTPEKGNGVKGAQKKERLSGSIEQRFRELRKLERHLQDEDSRRERARAKEAKAVQRKEYLEARAQLRAFAKEFCLEHANRPRPRKKAASVSEAELRKLGGVKEMVRRKDGLQSRIIFGGVGETRLIFTLWHGAWTVELDAKPALKEELKRELNKTRRNLWNADKEELDIAVQAVDALLSWSQDWQDFIALSKSEQERAMIYAQLAILTTLQALKRDVKNKSRKLQLAFELLTGQGAQSQIVKLRDHAVSLAAELQRPPSKKELKDRFDSTLPPHHPVRPSEFSKLLKAAGLSWLKRGKRGCSW